MIGADGKMKSVARAKVELRLIGVACGAAKILARHGKDPKALGGKPRERRGAAARCSAPRLPVRSLIDRAEANSVAVQSLIVSSDASCSASQV